MRLLFPLSLSACLLPQPRQLPPSGSTDSGEAESNSTCTVDVTAPSLPGVTPPAVDLHAEEFGPDPTPRHEHLGMPGTDASTSIALTWTTGDGTLSNVLEIGPADTWPEGATRHEGFSFLFGGDARAHEVHICGQLTPATAYTYRVGGEGAWSSTHTFTTAPSPDSTATLRLAFTGDSRGAPEVFGQLLSQMDALEPDVILFSGDMVQLGPNQDEWDDWWDAAGDIPARRLLVPTHGNHEFLALNYFAQFAMPNNEQWFTIRYGPLQLLSLNDTVADPVEISEQQPVFIRETLAQSDAPWRVAMHHRAVYTSSTAHPGDAELQALWSPEYEAGGVQMVINGHNHIYERSVPITAGAEAPAGGGPVYLVTGGSGAPLYTGVEMQWYTVIAEPTEHFGVADLTPQGADVVIRDLAGNEIDRFALPH